MKARRTSAAGRPAARAMASTSRPSSAPWRSSPTTRPAKKRCSSAVSRESSSLQRAALDVSGTLARRCARSRSSVASTSASSTVGVSAAAPDRARWSVAQPRPSLSCRTVPDRYAAAISISSAGTSASRLASSAILSRRPRVSPTRRDVSATWANLTCARLRCRRPWDVTIRVAVPFSHSHRAVQALSARPRQTGGGREKRALGR